MVTISLADNKLDGVGDGSHLLRQILENLLPGLEGDEEPEEDDQPEAAQEEGRKQPVERYVEVEVMVGLTLPEIVRIAAARNRSRSVPDYAVKNLEGKFDELKDALRLANRTFAERCVAFKPNETIEGSGDFKPLSILTIL